MLDTISVQSSSQISNSSSNVSLKEYQLTRQNAFVGETEFRKVQRCVKNVLKRTIHGRLILQVYNKTKVLTRKARNTLMLSYQKHWMISMGKPYI